MEEEKYNGTKKEIIQEEIEETDETSSSSIEFSAEVWDQEAYTEGPSCIIPSEGQGYEIQSQFSEGSEEDY